MSPTVPFTHSSQAARARLAKAQLLPVPRAMVGEPALRAHLSLEAIRAGADQIVPAQHVAHVILLTNLLVESGHGQLDQASLLAANRAMAELFHSGQKTGVWRISSKAVFCLLSEIVSMHDRQLQSASLGALTEANDRLERFKAGERYRPLQRRK